MSSFNLTRDPWIPVETLDGAVVELSSRETLARAHRLRALADPSPLVVAVLTRHLLALLHRAYDGPQTTKAWTAIARAGAFDAVPIDAYLCRVEDRMDLFHATHPFAQTRGLRERFGEYVAPIDEIEVVRARWGGGRELFRHRPLDPRPTMTPARAARALLAHHAFATGGLVKKPDEPTSATAAPLTRAGVVVLRGATVFHTLVANLLVYDTDHAKPFSTGGATDLCAWEQPPSPRELLQSGEPKRVPHGWLDLLTWQSRRVELVEETGVVTGFINAVGQGLAEGSPRDPMVTWRRHEKHGMLPLGIDVARGFWRESNALFEAARGEGSAYERPHAIDLVASPDAIDVLGPEAMFDVEVLGIATEKSRVDAVRTERVSVMARFFDDADVRSAVNGCLERSQELVAALKLALWTYARHALSPGARDPDTAAVRALMESFGAEAAAWSALGVLFEDLLRTLGGDADAAEKRFVKRAKRATEDVFRSATARPEDAGRWLKARALAERTLRQSLAPHIEPIAAQSPKEVRSDV